eukprot:Pompholyxophrys_punicea_v1_NODE_250_length_2534_cov_2.806374.p5 type:complete len:100 gc:universal NODE_250_length_2534_cov_2.806374:60-359(+)
MCSASATSATTLGSFSEKFSSVGSTSMFGNKRQLSCKAWRPKSSSKALMTPLPCNSGTFSLSKVPIDVQVAFLREAFLFKSERTSFVQRAKFLFNVGAE